MRLRLGVSGGMVLHLLDDFKAVVASVFLEVFIDFGKLMPAEHLSASNYFCSDLLQRPAALQM
jgi:hypothetical protein